MSAGGVPNIFGLVSTALDRAAGVPPKDLPRHENPKANWTISPDLILDGGDEDEPLPPPNTPREEPRSVQTTPAASPQVVPREQASALAHYPHAVTQMRSRPAPTPPQTMPLTPAPSPLMATQILQPVPPPFSEIAPRSTSPTPTQSPRDGLARPSPSSGYSPPVMQRFFSPVWSSTGPAQFVPEAPSPPITSPMLAQQATLSPSQFAPKLAPSFSDPPRDHALEVAQRASSPPLVQMLQEVSIEEGVPPNTESHNIWSLVSTALDRAEGVPEAAQDLQKKDAAKRGWHVSPDAMLEEEAEGMPVIVQWEEAPKKPVRSLQEKPNTTGTADTAYATNIFGHVATVLDKLEGAPVQSVPKVDAPKSDWGMSLDLMPDSTASSVAVPVGSGSAGASQRQQGGESRSVYSGNIFNKFSTVLDRVEGAPIQSIPRSDAHQAHWAHSLDMLPSSNVPSAAVEAARQQGKSQPMKSPSLAVRHSAPQEVKLESTQGANIFQLVSTVLDRTEGAPVMPARATSPGLRWQQTPDLWPNSRQSSVATKPLSVVVPAPPSVAVFAAAPPPQTPPQTASVDSAKYVPQRSVMDAADQRQHTPPTPPMPARRRDTRPPTPPRMHPAPRMITEPVFSGPPLVAASMGRTAVPPTARARCRATSPVFAASAPPPQRPLLVQPQFHRAWATVPPGHSPTRPEPKLEPTFLDRFQGTVVMAPRAKSQAPEWIGKWGEALALEYGMVEVENGLIDWYDWEMLDADRMDISNLERETLRDRQGQLDERLGVLEHMADSIIGDEELALIVKEHTEAGDIAGAYGERDFGDKFSPEPLTYPTNECSFYPDDEFDSRVGHYFIQRDEVQEREDYLETAARKISYHPWLYELACKDGRSCLQSKRAIARKTWRTMHAFAEYDDVALDPYGPHRSMPLVAAV